MAMRLVEARARCLLEACARAVSSLDAAGLMPRRSTDKVVCWRPLRMQLSAGSFLDGVSGGGLVECSMDCRNCCVPETENASDARPQERSSNCGSLAGVRLQACLPERLLGAARPRRCYCKRDWRSACLRIGGVLTASVSAGGPLWLWLDHNTCSLQG